MTLDDIERRIQGLPKVFSTPSGTGKATDFKNLDSTFKRVHPNEIPLSFLEKKERGRNQGLPSVYVPAIISGRGKATHFKFDRYIHTAGSIRTKTPVKNFGEKGAWA